MNKFFKSLALIAVAAFGFASCEDVPAPYNLPSLPEKPVTVAKPITCAEAIEIVNALPDNGETTEVYEITGYIVDVFATISKGQQSFWLSDSKGGSKQIQAYWANLPEGVAAFKADTKVKITGKLMKFINTSGNLVPEVKNAEVEILGAGEEGPADAIEKTCAEAAEIVAGMADGATSAETYKLTGYITDVFATVSKGQQSFWMADTKDGGKIIQAYWANLPEGVASFEKGSKVTITGKLLKYVKDGVVTPEIKNADVVILEKAEGGDQGGGDQGGEKGEPTGEGSEANPYNVAGALAYITTLADGEKPTNLVYTKGVIAEVVKMGTSGSIQFKMQDKDVENELLVYYCDNLGKKPFTALTDLKIGDEVIVCGTVQNYKGNTPEYNSGSYLVSLNGKTEAEGGDQGGDQGGDKGEANEYSNGLTYTAGQNFYEQVATINSTENVQVLKIGTSSKAGDFTLTVPAGKHSFYAVSWKGSTNADVVLKKGAETFKTITVSANEGAAGNPPYTMTVSASDKYEFEVSEACTLTVTSDKRVIFFGIK